MPLPPSDGDGGAPLILGGVLAAPLVDSDEVDDALRLLAGEDVARRLIDTGLFLSPHLGTRGAAPDACPEGCCLTPRSQP